MSLAFPPIASLLPHSGDMVLLDELLHCDDDSACARLRVRPGLLSDERGDLPAWMGVELMAQCVGAFAGMQARREQRPPQLGFLLGTRAYQCNVAAFAQGSELRVRAIASLRDDGGMNVFECHIDGEGVTAFARLNLYAPRDLDRFLQDSTP